MLKQTMLLLTTFRFANNSFSTLIRSLQHHSSRQDTFLLSLSVSGNYYGTPRPVHISAESPPITYQEHRNLLRNFRTRSKSLSNLEKAAEDGENSEEDSGLSGKYDGMCGQGYEYEGKQGGNQLLIVS